MKQKKSSIERSQDSLFSKLKKLKECGILKHSITPEVVSSDFEILEFYGDSVLYERIAFFLLKTRRFMCPDLLSKIRQECINNRNLAQCFDILSLRELTTYATSDKPLLLKAKADVVEAIIGELAEAIDRNDAVTRDAETKTILDELLAYISYNGEKEFFAMGSPAIAQTSQKTPSPPHHKTPSPPHQQNPAAPLSSAPAPHPTTPVRAFSKQNFYKNNINPHYKYSRKGNFELNKPQNHTSPPPSQPQNLAPPPQSSPQKHPSPQPLAAPLPVFPPPQAQIPAPSPTQLQRQEEQIQAQLQQLKTQQQLFLQYQSYLTKHASSLPLPLPRPHPADPIPKAEVALPDLEATSPTSEVFLGGRNVAIFTAT